MNIASRVMDIGDNNHIVLSEPAYESIRDMSEDVDIDEYFKKIPGVRIKHGSKIDVYQYIKEDVNVSKSQLIAEKEIEFENSMKQAIPITGMIREPETDEERIEQRKQAAEIIAKLGDLLRIMGINADQVVANMLNARNMLERQKVSDESDPKKSMNG